MRVIVTGAAGFVGRNVVAALIEKEHQVIAVDVDREALNHMGWNDDVERLVCDIYTEDGVTQLVEKKPELVMHLAWKGLPNFHELFHFERNLPENYAFLRELVLSGIKRLQVIGTCFEYGLKNGMVSEDEPTCPVTSYGLAKDCLRKFLEQLKKKENFKLQWCRLFYPYGEGQASKSLYSQLRHAIDQGEETFNMSGGEQLRDYLPVERVAELLVDVAENESFEGLVNICSGKPVSIRTLVEKWIEECSTKIVMNLGYYPYAEYEPMAFWGDMRRLQSLLKR